MSHLIKITTLAITLLGMSTFACATDEQIYLGMGFATGSGSQEAKGNFGTSEDDLDQTQGDIEVGYVFASGKRLEVSFTSIDVENGGDKAEYAGIDFDWHFPLSTGKVQPFLGVGFGLYEFKDSAKNFDQSDDLGGLALNFLGGVFIPASEELEFEISYKIKGIGWEVAEQNGNEVELSSGLSAIAFSGRFKF